MRQTAEELENLYVANHETIGRMAVTTKAIPDAIAQPRYTEDVYGDGKLFSVALNNLYFKSSKGLADTIAPRAITDPANTTTQIQRIIP